MKIAIPATGDLVDGHFGHCEEFAIFSIDENKNVMEENRIKPPAGCGCKSNVIPLLAQMGVKVMLAGNMGMGAVNLLEASGIQVVRGCAGDIRDTVKHWADGQIVDSGEGCTEHGGNDCHK
ncbi:MAG: NifB/NifX family molybdenum-iron cluster-binding protein [Planctomycetes bacterium]|nr:NifB/NifX family molybdenum-iron cluster-binding protein [Planctomycetota bacterium]